MSDTENLTLKWGSIKGWECPVDGPFKDALQRWIDSGPEYQAMRHNTPEQTQMIVEIIDACNGEIWNDWDGFIMTKERAKEYVLNYGKDRAATPKTGA